ncbi:hypothetical protein [Rhodococcoides corynebacterioides]|uniref:hypothetical protein n=1 Tax=Rhodococcoides corynebacterioides TaxID=53972 RepID=UPI00082D6919|nr:hypothetical protein [Rhodococcus corynebacterioides]
MSVVETLLAGPRGRRLLLEYALTADRLSGMQSQNSFHTAVFLAAYRLDVDRGSGVVMFGPGAEEARRTVVTAEEVADRLSRVVLPEVTAKAVRQTMELSMDFAQYWQEPDGADVLAATEAVRGALRRVAEHVAQSPWTEWWSSDAVLTEQWAVGRSFGDAGLLDDSAVGRPAAEVLSEWSIRTAVEEERAARERPLDPTASVGGEWWSNPPTLCSSRLLADGTPAGLWFVEDGSDPARAVSRRVTVAEGARVFEVDGPQAWAQLCRRFPLEVTAQKRHEWYRTTGRSGRWVIPDWLRVAEVYDGVHLTTTGYLSAATTAIPVDDDCASVIAGWAPDETYWFTDAARIVADDVRLWVSESDGERLDWVEDDQPPA